MSAAQYSQASIDERTAALRRQMTRSPVPGLIAYVEDVPAGWCGFVASWQMIERLVRSRTIPVVDDTAVWSIVCFAVSTAHRRRGLARALLDGTIEHARACGAPALETYPIDLAGRRVQGAAAYVGTTSMFENAGFLRLVETEARSARLPRWLDRLSLDERQRGRTCLEGQRSPV